LIFSYSAQTGEQIRATQGTINEMKYDQKVGWKVAGDGGRTRVLRVKVEGVMVAGEVAAEVVAGAACGGRGGGGVGSFMMSGLKQQHRVSTNSRIYTLA
jgi:hypothetical protein